MAVFCGEMQRQVILLRFAYFFLSERLDTSNFHGKFILWRQTSWFGQGDHGEMGMPSSAGTCFGDLRLCILKENHGRLSRTATPVRAAETLRSFAGVKPHGLRSSK